MNVVHVYVVCCECGVCVCVVCCECGVCVVYCEWWYVYVCVCVTALVEDLYRY